MPNLSQQNIEKFKISLEKLNKCFKKTPFSINKCNYEKYLEFLKTLFPNNYFFFYKELLNNEVFQIDNKTSRLRKSDYRDNQQNIENSLLTIKQKNKEIAFTEKVKKELFTFIKSEIVPQLKGKGSYNKLLFFRNLGNIYNEFSLNIKNHEDCFSIKNNPLENKQNSKELIENLKIKSIKNYSQLNSNNIKNNLAIDTLSKILIVYLNALLLEELHNKIIPVCEQEIKESKEIFEEEVNKLPNSEEKNILIEIFNKLNKDYYEINENNFSNIFLAYLYTFSIKPELSLIKL